MAPDPNIADLITEFYDELVQLAKRLLLRERPGHEMESNDLVHECYLRLRHVEKLSRDSFLSEAKHAMRRILNDVARVILYNFRNAGWEAKLRREIHKAALDAKVSGDPWPPPLK